MTTTISFNRNLLSFVVPLTLFLALILLIKFPIVEGSNELNIAITADLVVSVPLIYYLLIRGTSIPKTSVLPMMLIGLLIGSYFLPPQNQTYLSLFKTWVLPILELTVFAVIVVKVRQARQRYQSIQDSSRDFFSILINICREMVPKRLAIPFATEIAVFYYGFIHWKSIPLHKNEFSYHRETGTQATLGALILVIIIETIAVHLLLSSWSPLTAWILTGLSFYAAMQMLGFAKALSKRPVTINENLISLRYGIMAETEFTISDIDRIEYSKQSTKVDTDVTSLSPLGDLEEHNVCINLKTEQTLTSIYGTKKVFTKIGLHLDEPVLFGTTIEAAIGKIINKAEH